MLDDRHYARLRPQPIDVAEAWELDHHCATALKYLARAGHKEGCPMEDDLSKAVFYLKRRIALCQATTKGLPVIMDVPQAEEPRCQGGTFCAKKASRMKDGRWLCRPHAFKEKYCRKCERKVRALVSGLCRSCDTRKG